MWINASDTPYEQKKQFVCYLSGNSNLFFFSLIEPNRAIQSMRVIANNNTTRQINFINDNKIIVRLIRLI